MRGGVGDHGDAGVVLGGGAYHGGPADVDLLDVGVEGGARANNDAEKVEVDHDEVDGGHAQLRDPAHVLGLAAVGEDPGMDGRVQGLDPALKALGEAGDVLHRSHRQARAGDGGGGGAGGDDLGTGVDEGGGQLDQF